MTIVVESRIPSNFMNLGQIELYTHHPLLPALMSHLSRSGMRTCAIYLVESQFMEDRYKYFRFMHETISYGFLALKLLSSSLVVLCLPCLQW